MNRNILIVAGCWLAAAAASSARTRQRDKLMSLLEQYEDCPFRTRNNVDELVEDLLEKAEGDDVHDYDVQSKY